MKAALTFLLLLLMTMARGLAVSYYVDFVGGSDAAAGTSTAAAWQHCPGDANATSVAAAATIGAGDTVNFKGGVRYEGKISATASGTSGNKAVYDGSPAAWGTGKAMVDATSALTWNVCTGEGSGATQVQNSNFANIYYAALPVGADWKIPVFENDVWLAKAGTPNTADPWFYADTDYFQAVTSGLSNTSCTDAAFFNQSDSSYWDGAVILYHITGNGTAAATITSFNPATDTVSYSGTGTPYLATNWDNKYHYTVINSQRQITAGTYAVDVAGSRILAWPNAGNASGLRASTRTYGFHTSGRSYLTIKNFRIHGQYGTTYESGRHISGSTSTATNGLLVDACDLHGSEGGGATAGIYVFGAGTDRNYVQNCTLDRVYGRGIFGTGDKFTFSSNELSRVTGTVLYSQNNSTTPNTNGEFLNNYIHDCKGTHANGMTVYGQSGTIASGFLISGNRVLRQYHRFGPYAASMQHHRNIEFRNNVLDGQIADDGATAGSDYIRWYNNTISWDLRIFAAQNSAECIVKNNIILGGLWNNTGENWADIDYQNNVYETLHYRQSPSYGWTIGPNEVTGATTAALFTDYAGFNWTLKAGSPAINAGTDLSAFFTTDLTGAARSGTWDVGAYEYGGGGGGGNITTGSLTITGP